MRLVPVRGWEDLYKVSASGRVYSVRRGVFLKPALDGGGYPCVVLCRNTERKMRKVHRLVIEAFTDPATWLAEAAHRNGVRADCRRSNLRWSTRKDNQRDRRRHGTAGKKLTELTAYRIKRAQGTHAEVATRYSVHQSTVSRIKKGEMWA